jgi:hypothetical protein
MISYTILIIIGIVGMGRAEKIPDIVIILRVLVRITYNEADRRTRRLSLKDTTEQFHLVRLIA